MTQIQSKKKFCKKTNNYSLSGGYLNGFLSNFNDIFIVHRRDNSLTAKNYIEGLFKTEKGHANMERIEEEIEESNYRAYQHFISNSKWDYKELIKRVGIQTSNILSDNKQRSGKPTGYIIDESAHLKQGKTSVGVARQYAGVAGKVDNCQVGVYSSLVNDKFATIVNERLFLPENWTSSEEKCEKAKIPETEREFKTKPELALEMIDEDLNRGVKFDWVGGDGLYGYNFELTKGLDERDCFYVLDIHKDQRVYLEEPQIDKVIVCKGKNSGKQKFETKSEPVRVDHYMQGLNHTDWYKAKIRETAKGWLKLKVHTIEVWVWNGEEEKARKRTLVISKTKDSKPKIKYSISNGSIHFKHPKEYAYFQSQRYWVERTFDDGKNELGMSDYQMRKWIGWHHHQALVMMASLYILQEKIKNQTQYPLMSVRDARILIITSLFGTPEQIEKKVEQMNVRHHKRQKDIDRYYRKEKQWEEF